jgi:hypothetical protein
MAASGWLIRMKLGGSHGRTVVDGDEHPTAGLAQPPCSRRVFTGVGRPAVGIAGGKDLLHESPDGGPIRIDGIADLHFGILTGATYAASMTESVPSRSSQIVLWLPFAGRWLARNSPARRVPSHGTDLLGERYAIDFVGVDHRRRTADRRDWRTFFASEPAERFFAYGRPILAPADGTVVDVHDRELDHVGRRSQLTLVPYALGQPARLRQGVGAIAGNYLIIGLREEGVFVALVHLRAGSIRVAIGEVLSTGQPVAQCGNSGNSTQPHLHVQVMDSQDLSVARGLPMAFRRFREWPRGAKHPQIRECGLPGEGAVVEPLLDGSGPA